MGDVMIYILKTLFKRIGITALLVFGFFTTVSAESMVDGIYMSDGDERGLARCTLTVEGLEMDHKYGDEVFRLESSGDGSCEWSAMGISKSYSIAAGLVTNAGAETFIVLSFPFGPSGGRIKVTMYELDGEFRQEDVFTKTDELVAVN